MIPRAEVLAALKSHKGHSLHLMEIVETMKRPRGERDRVLDVLRELAELGFVRELPGNRWKSGDAQVAARVRSSKKGNVDEGRAAPKAARRESAEPSPRSPRSSGSGSSGSGSSGSRTDGSRRPARSSRVSDAPVPESIPEAVPFVPRPYERHRVGELVEGWLSMSNRGFGFLTPIDGSEDVFVPAPAIGLALHGDRVIVRVREPREPARRRGSEGEVARILVRALTRVGGTLVRGRRHYEVQLGDPRLPAFARIEGELPLGARTGLEVVVQVTGYPEAPGEPLVGRVLEVLGPRGSAAVEVEKIRIREGIVEAFPDDVRREALALPAQVPASDIATREDLRDLALLTIDPEDARDHDDAVYAEPHGEGYRVVVAIADVSHYVRPGTAIDREAVERATSIYLPDRAIPMLPPELSSNLASLLPNEDRLTLGVEVIVSSDGRVRRHRYIDGVMRSRARLTYGMVAKVLGWTEADIDDAPARSFLPGLEVLAAASKALRARRDARGALDFELPEPRIKLDDQGEPIDSYVQKGDLGVKRAYALIEDFMLLANEVVAEDLSRRGALAIYRVHGKPDEKKIGEFSRVAAVFGHELPEGAASDPRLLSQYLESIAGTPMAGPLGYLLLRSMQQASYRIENEGHFALALRHYLHFTSPIRRYPDVAVHRVVRRLMRDQAEAESAARDLTIQAVQSSRMERRAMQVEREAQALYRTILMKPRVGDEVEGRVSSLAEHGLFVNVESPFVEVKVPIDRVGNDYYELDPLGIALVGRRSGQSISLGDAVRVRIDEASLERREVVASLVAVAESVRRGRRRGGDAPKRRGEAMTRGEGPRTRGDAPRRGDDAPRRGDGPRGRASELSPRGRASDAPSTRGSAREGGDAERPVGALRGPAKSSRGAVKLDRGSTKPSRGTGKAARGTAKAARASAKSEGARPAKAARPKKRGK